MQEKAEPEKNYSAREAAEILGMSVFTVRELLKKNLLGGFRITRHWRIPESDLNRFMKKSRNEAATSE